MHGDPGMSLEALLLAMPRTLVLFAVVPFLSGTLLTGLVRNALVLMLGLFVALGIEAAPPASTGLLVVLMGKEALIGLILGLGFGGFVWAIQSVGDLIDFQTGSANASFFDPVAGHDTGATSEFLVWVAMTLFVAAGGLLAMLNVLFDSYRIWPVGALAPDLPAALQRFAIVQGDSLFQLIVKLAAPVIFVLVLVDLGFGLIGRAAPALNVFQATQPLKSLAAHLMLLLFLYFLFDSLQSSLRIERGMLETLRSLTP